jgi:outer membrane usher protein
LLWAGGRPWPAQTLAGPAALLVVPDLGGVAVLHDGQPVGRTDDSGRIIVPSLRPFEDNTLTIVPEDIPLTALVDSDKISVRPYSHGVVSVTLAVAANESRVFALRLAPEIFVPPGAEVTLDGHAFPVGTQGIAQLPVARAASEAIASWPGGRCRVRLPDLAAAKRAGDDPLVVDCKGL